MKINFKVTKIYDSWEIREIIVHGATNSVSTRLFFERLKDSIIPTHAWGIKINDKFLKQQAGPPSSGVIRILIVNFILTDISCKLFDNMKYYQNIEKILHYHAKKINPFPPFEIVLLGNLDYNCTFANPIILGDSNNADFKKRLTEIGLNGE